MEPLDELRTLIARHARSGQPASAIEGVRLVASEAPTLTVHAVAEPSFAVVAQGAKHTVLGDRVFDYGAGDLVLTTTDLPIASCVVAATPARPYLAAGMTLRPAAVASLMLETAADDHPAPVPTALAVTRAGPELVESLVRLLRLLDRPADRAVLGAAIEREILWRLLAGPEGPRVRQVGLADSRLAQVSRAIRWIRAHYAEPLRIAELASLAAMSQSSLHRHFRAVTAMTPLQYQKQIRLQQARARLLAEPGEVAAIGFAVGYDSPSQFSREYRRLFGAPPGRDMARLRDATAPVEDLA